ncbi:MAG: site-specific integrase [Oscillospiraceae bacterium]|nr:site-specific integrase [Oscillospiraceae bacterium]
MAKGSVRKKGKKWYYRFYVENDSGELIQKEFVGTESKSETQAMLRKAMEDYESKKFIAKSENITLGDLLDMWIEEAVKPGNLSNGTVMAYQGTVHRIKRNPIGARKLKNVTSEHLQKYVDSLVLEQGLSKGYMRLFWAVLQGAFKFAVYPKRFISFNPMQYIVQHSRKEEYELFSEKEQDTSTISYEQFKMLTDYLKDSTALLPVQIAYYTGLRIGEVCGLTWQDIDLKEQYLTVRRSMRSNSERHRTEIGTTKRNKIRTVDFCDTLAEILRKAKREQNKNRIKYGELYNINYYMIEKEKGRTYYDVYTLPRTSSPPDDYEEISFVCTRMDGTYTLPNSVGTACRSAKKKLPGLENFHFHMLRHTFTSNLLSHGAAPKDVQELLGHSDVSTTMNIYAHASREAKRASARLLDKVVVGE